MRWMGNWRKAAGTGKVVWKPCPPTCHTPPRSHGAALGPSEPRNPRLAEDLGQGDYVPRALPGSRAFTLGIVGAGVMGTTIAAEALRRGFRVAITDIRPECLGTVRTRIATELADPQALGAAWHQAVRRRLEPTTSVARLGRCAVVLESVTEDPNVKRSVLARLEPLLASDAILATNTSTIPIAELAAALADPGRFCGLHFFHPVRCRPLVEVVRGSRTSQATLVAAERFVRQMGKVPVVVGDGPGFLVNRLLFPYLGEALELLLEGVGPERLEGIARRFGMAMGPLRLLDEIGLDTALFAGRVLFQAFPDRIVPSPLLIAMYKAGRWGQKSGAGFFQYAEAQQPGDRKLDPEAERLIAAWSRDCPPLSDEQVLHRLLLPMVLEATRLLAEGRVGSPEEIDRAAVLGLGFPASVGGPLAWAAQLGPQQVLRLLEPWLPLGPRMQPTEWLLEAAGCRPQPQPPFHQTSPDRASGPTSPAPTLKPHAV